MTTKLRAAQRTEWAKQAEMRRRRIILIWVAAGVIFVAMLGYLIYKQATPAPRPGVDVTVQGRDHIAEGVPHDPYNSDPPTSGRGSMPRSGRASAPRRRPAPSPETSPSPVPA